MGVPQSMPRGLSAAGWTEVTAGVLGRPPASRSLPARAPPRTGRPSAPGTRGPAFTDIDRGSAGGRARSARLLAKASVR